MMYTGYSTFEDNLFYDTAPSRSRYYANAFDEFEAMESEHDEYFDGRNEFDDEDLDYGQDGQETAPTTREVMGVVLEDQKTKNRGRVREGETPMQIGSQVATDGSNRPLQGSGANVDGSYVDAQGKRQNLEGDDREGDVDGHQRRHLQVMKVKQAEWRADRNPKPGGLQQEPVKTTGSTFVRLQRERRRGDEKDVPVEYIVKTSYEDRNGTVVAHDERIDFPSGTTVGQVINSGVLEQPTNQSHLPPGSKVTQADRTVNEPGQGQSPPGGQRSPQTRSQQPRSNQGQRSPQTRSSRSSPDHLPQRAQRTQVARSGQTRPAQRMQPRSQQARPGQSLSPQQAQRSQPARLAQRMQRPQSARPAQMRSQAAQRMQPRSQQARPGQSLSPRRVQRSQAARPSQRMQRSQSARLTQMRSRSATPQSAQRARRTQRNRFDAFAEFF